MFCVEKVIEDIAKNRKKEFSRKDLENVAMYGVGFGKLGLPCYPLLMIDYAKVIAPDHGPIEFPLSVESRKDIYTHDWYFKAHFAYDPVMPGCLTVESLWQSISFLAGWYFIASGEPVLSTNCVNRARVLRSGQIKFKNQTLPSETELFHYVTMKSITSRTIKRGDETFKICLIHGNGVVKSSDGKESCSVSDIVIRFGPLFEEDFIDPNST